MLTPPQQNLYTRIYNWAAELPSSGSGVRDIPSLGCAVGSSVGQTRKTNQDQLVVAKACIASSPKSSFVLFALLDGMGGMKEGGECARIAISAFVSALVFTPESNLKQQVSTAVQLANQVVYDQFRGDGGTTLSALIVTQNNEAVLLNVGDSRIYEFSLNGQVKQLTIDDTISSALAQVNFSENRKRPDHTDPSQNQLLQYIGIGQDLEPHVIPIQVNFKDKGYVLATDGAYKLPSNVFEQLIANSHSPKEAVRRINSVSDWIGGHDNASAICLWPSSTMVSELFKDSFTSHLRLFGLTETIDIQGQLSQRQFNEERVVQSLPNTFAKPMSLPPSKGAPAKRTRNKSTKSQNKRKKGGHKERFKDEGFLPHIEIKLGDNND